MVNIYFLYCSNNSVPTGWTEISSSYQNRLIKISTSSLLATAGSDTHTHTVSTAFSLASGGATQVTKTSTSSNNVNVSNHTHTAGGTHTLSSDSSLPYYKNYRMIYKDASTFNGNLPAGAACIRGSLPASDWEWDESEDCFIRTSSSYGTKSGNNSHTHTYTGYWNSTTSSTSARNNSGTTQSAFGASHTHYTSGTPAQVTTDSSDHTYKWWGGGVCKTSSVVSTLPAYSYCFFDGSPPSGWTTVNSYNGYFVKNLASRSISDGGTDSTHTHTISATVAGGTGTVYPVTVSTTRNVVRSDHTHSLTGGSLASVLPTPSNVTFLIAYNANDVSPVTTRDKTYTMDTLIQKRYNKTYILDTLLQKQNSHTYVLDALVKKITPKGYILDSFIRKNNIGESFYLDVFLKKVVAKSLNFDVFISKTGSKGYSMRALLDVAIFTRIKELSLDLLLLKKGQQTYVLDTMLKRKIFKPYIIDTLLLKKESKAISQDVLLAERLYSSFYLDLLLKQIKTSSIGLDLLTKKTLSKSYVLKMILLTLTRKEYHFDIIVKKVIYKTLNCDILIAKRIPGQYFIDILLASRSYASFAIDTMLSKSFCKQYSIDFYTKKEEHSFHIIDTLIAKRSSYCYFMKSLFKSQRSHIYKVATFIKGKVRDEYYIDVIILTEEAAKYRKRRPIDIDTSKNIPTIIIDNPVYVHSPITVSKREMKESVLAPPTPIIEHSSFVFSPDIKRAKRELSVILSS